MQRALELARRGIGVTSPNPAIGCIQLNHAEIVALKEARQPSLGHYSEV
jgi:pyrimidine deaminase RibD-like protein